MRRNQIITTNNAEHYVWGNNCSCWHLLNNANLSVKRELMPPHTQEILHYHSFSEQLFYILFGRAEIEINGNMEEVTQGESLHVPPKTIHRITNLRNEDLHFLLISSPRPDSDRVEIIDYTDDLKDYIKILNYEWLQKYFKVEKEDSISLADPRGEILNNHGFIFYVRLHNNIVGTVSLLKVTDHVYELAKMAVTDSSQGFGIGNMLIQHCFNVAKQNSISKLILYSNRSLGPAIHLYKKFGFKEIELESGHYERADIKMEKIIEQ